ncbi:hypothetical protein GC194_14480 [bacterium]|nr:hypothetical protein [bacterium]
MKLKWFVLLAALVFVPFPAVSQGFLQPMNFGSVCPENLTELFASTFIDSADLFDEFHHFNGQLLAFDINKDNEIDYVFHGWRGGEGYETYLFLKSENGFETEHFNGHVIDYKEYSVTIYESACCDAYWSHIKVYTVADKKFVFKLENKYLMESSMTRDSLVLQGLESFFGKSNGADVELIETTNEIYHLRSAPIIDNEVQQGILYTNIGNIVASYPKGSRGCVLASTSDTTGRIWYLVVMEHNLPLSYSLFPDRFSSDKFIGWMSSRYLLKNRN